MNVNIQQEFNPMGLFTPHFPDGAPIFVTHLMRRVGQTALAAVTGLIIGLHGGLASADIIYVTNFTSNNVYRIDSATPGGTVTNFIPSFSSPLGIATAAGQIIVSTFNGIPQIYNSSGTLVGHFSQALSAGFGITTTAAGNFLIADAGSGSIKTFSPSGAFSGTLASVSGFPSGIAVDRTGNIFVTEATGNVVVKLSSTGHLLATFGSGHLSTPQGIAVAPDGTVYVSSRDYGNVTKYGNDGTYEGVFASSITDAYGLLVNPSGHVFVVSSFGGNAVLEFDSSATLLNTMHLPNNSTPLYLAEGAASVPEPASLALLGMGAAALATLRRRHSTRCRSAAPIPATD